MSAIPKNIYHFLPLRFFEAVAVVFFLPFLTRFEGIGLSGSSSVSSLSPSTSSAVNFRLLVAVSLLGIKAVSRDGTKDSWLAGGTGASSGCCEIGLTGRGRGMGLGLGATGMGLGLGATAISSAGGGVLPVVTGVEGSVAGGGVLVAGVGGSVGGVGLLTGGVASLGGGAKEAAD